MDHLLQVEMEDVEVDVPHPIIPAQEWPRVIMPVIEQGDFTQKLADLPVIIFVSVSS